MSDARNLSSRKLSINLSDLFRQRTVPQRVKTIAPQDHNLDAIIGMSYWALSLKRYQCYRFRY